MNKGALFCSSEIIRVIVGAGVVKKVGIRWMYCGKLIPGFCLVG